jgi:hypothetical protein
MLSHYLTHSNLYFQDSSKGRCKLKEKAIAEYKAALKMPRKKKKIAKKSALLLYSIACWSPFNN